MPDCCGPSARGRKHRPWIKPLAILLGAVLIVLVAVLTSGR